jgi:hypothetical protein
MTAREKIVVVRPLAAPTWIGHAADHVDDSVRHGRSENGGGPRRVVIANYEMEIRIPITRFRDAVEDEAHGDTVVVLADLDRKCFGQHCCCGYRGGSWT